MTVPMVSPHLLYERLREGTDIELIDVRTPVEFQELHVPGSRLVPLDRLDPVVVQASRVGKPGDPLYVLCRSGGRARAAVERLHQAGLTQALCVDGGIQAWEKEGFPVARGPRGVSLERQVRIAAGSLVLLGSALTLLSPWLALAPAFVGAGLVFSGVTDTCGMGLLLARMPWNRVKGQEASCCAR